MTRKKISLKRNSLAVFVFFLPVILFAQNIEDNFKEANSAYNSGDYSAAINLYSGLISQGYRSKELYFNLGTAYLQIDSIASANLYLERALKLAPFDKRVQENLALARSKVETDIYEVPQFLLKRIWDVWANLLQPNGWMILQICLLFIILVLVYIRLFRASKKQHNRFSLAIFILLLMLITSIITGAYAANQRKSINTGIVMLNDKLYSGPDERSAVIQNISSGVKVIILDEINDWLHVELLNKEAGWVRDQGIDRI